MKPAKDSSEVDELKRLRAENTKLKADAQRSDRRAEKLSTELGKTRTALEIAGKAFALLENISSSADFDEK